MGRLRFFHDLELSGSLPTNSNSPSLYVGSQDAPHEYTIAVAFGLWKTCGASFNPRAPGRHSIRSHKWPSFAQIRVRGAASRVGEAICAM